MADILPIGRDQGELIVGYLERIAVALEKLAGIEREEPKPPSASYSDGTLVTDAAYSDGTLVTDATYRDGTLVFGKEGGASYSEGTVSAGTYSEGTLVTDLSYVDGTIA